MTLRLGTQRWGSQEVKGVSDHTTRQALSEAVTLCVNPCVSPPSCRRYLPLSFPAFEDTYYERQLQTPPKPGDDREIEVLTPGPISLSQSTL